MCLLLSDNRTCPVQVQYQNGPIFRKVGLGVWLYGVWLYGAARGTLQVRCSAQGLQPGSDMGHYKLIGTGAFWLQRWCEASFGQIKVPSYANGQGQFKLDPPDAPIVNLFLVNFTIEPLEQHHLRPSRSRQLYLFPQAPNLRFRHPERFPDPKSL